jgi:RimJ/RimL family protein N-acetyltransferase
MASVEWMVERPPERIDLDQRQLRRVLGSDAPDLMRAVNESLDHLRPWMVWAAQPATEESMLAFATGAEESWDAGREFHYVIRSDGEVLGACGLHDRTGPGVLEIGYWVHVAHTGQGVITAAARSLTDVALGLPAVESVEIRCDPANWRSAAVPRRLGYELIADGADGGPMIWRCAGATSRPAG